MPGAIIYEANLNVQVKPWSLPSISWIQNVMEEIASLRRIQTFKMPFYRAGNYIQNIGDW